jgi:cell division protein YceG involved in septum cleavage
MKWLLRSPLYLMLLVLTGTFCVAVITFGIYAVSLKWEKTETKVAPDNYLASPFPVGVSPLAKTIVENPAVDVYVRQYLSINPDQRRKERFLDKLIYELAKLDFYQQLASPLTRILVIYSGERKEEVIKNFGDILDWSQYERDEFIKIVTETSPSLTDGKFYPGRYTVAKTATPQEVADLVLAKFATEIANRYDETIEATVPLKDALVIASLLEREAYDFTDMRVISGVIWNRLFIDMPLQLDASLQYTKGSNLNEAKWWPKVIPGDKFVESPYNTYQETGLPPAPIANPSVEAVVAALNPRKTECMFYFHDDDGSFYCSNTYEEHVALLKSMYGRGQ